MSPLVRRAVSPTRAVNPDFAVSPVRAMMDHRTNFSIHASVPNIATLFASFSLKLAKSSRTSPSFAVIIRSAVSAPLNTNPCPSTQVLAMTCAPISAPRAAQAYDHAFIVDRVLPTRPAFITFSLHAARATPRASHALALRSAHAPIVSAVDAIIIATSLASFAFSSVKLNDP